MGPKESLNTFKIDLGYYHCYTSSYEDPITDHKQ